MTGISVAQDHAADGPAVEIGADPVTDVSREFAESAAFQRALLEAVRDLVDGHTPAGAGEKVRDAGVDALGGFYRDVCLTAASGDESGVWDLLTFTRQLGHGQTSADLRSDRDDVIAGQSAVFQAIDTTPTVTLRLIHEFRELRASQRWDVLDHVLTLVDGCDVRLATDAIGERFIATHHAKDLPDRVVKVCNPRQDRPATDGRVAVAWATLDPKGSKVKIIEDVADTEEGVREFNQRCPRNAGDRWLIDALLLVQSRSTPV